MKIVRKLWSEKGLTAVASLVFGVDDRPRQGIGDSHLFLGIRDSHLFLFLFGRVRIRPKRVPVQDGSATPRVPAYPRR